jgi:proline dehydrogenase
MYAGAKAIFYALSRSAALKRLASTYGMRAEDSFARRFIAGETIDEAIEAARGVQAQGLRLTLDYLGESVRTLDEATAATREYLRLLDVIVTSGIERNISLKITQLGAGVDRATCVDNLRRILEPAGRHGFFVRIDMENSPWTQLTLEIVETLWQQQYRNVGIALQAALYRTEQDVRRMNELGVRVRLVKGAYKEPQAVAYQQKTDVDAAFRRLMRLLIDSGNFPAIATHDPAMIEATCSYARQHGRDKNAFEFQMLYGIRRDLQASLAAEGHGMRLYIPFGREWFPSH